MNFIYVIHAIKKYVHYVNQLINNKNDIIINYDDKDYICMKHNDSFIKYCKTCNENLCILCENEHNYHNLIDFRKILINKNVLININTK